MISLVDLWLPILLSAVVVFVVSSIIHMALPIHKGDYKKLSGEKQILDTMRAQGVSPGSYMFPCPGSMKDMCTPEMMEKYHQGPVGYVTIIPSGPPAMGKSLVLWFLYSIVIGVGVASAGAATLSRGAEFSTVFRLTAVIAILAYAASYCTDSIWKGQRWGITVKFIFDGVVYGLVTAATFGWLWPATI